MLIAVALLALAVVGALRWLDVTWYPVVVAQTAGAFVAVGLGLLLVVTLLLRRWWMLAPVGVLTVIAATFAVPPFFAHTS
ncbi:MAG: endonuclease/exonuclease/phosphatase family protein, partial [Terracoccus sp.]